MLMAYAVAICSKQIVQNVQNVHLKGFWKVSVDVSNGPSTHWADLWIGRIRGIAKKLGGVVQGETFKRLQRMSIPPKQISLNMFEQVCFSSFLYV